MTKWQKLGLTWHLPDKGQNQLNYKNYGNKRR